LLCNFLRNTSASPSFTTYALTIKAVPKFC
jgi:hypothetical protein